MIVLNPGNIRVIALRMLTPYRGVWLADLELDPDVVAPSSGKVVIAIGEPPGVVTTLTGTIDPRGSGAFATLYRLRVLGGGAGWDQAVTPQHYHSDGGIPNTQVYATTAILVGEVASVLVPAMLGIDFVRSAGPASRVLDAEPSWWVDPTTGVTTIGPRPPAVPDPSLTLLFWDAAQQRAELTCDALVAPGTPIVDPRLGAPVTVRDVEQTFGPHGSQVVAWCSPSAESQLADDLRAMALEFSGVKYARTYLYRIVLQAPDGRLSVQAARKTDGVPDSVMVSPWSGVPGASAKWGTSVGSAVRLAFLGGDPSAPVVDSYALGVLPDDATYDANVTVHVGPHALHVALAGGTSPLVLAAPYAALLSALETFATAVGTATTPAQIATAGGELATALGLLPAPATVRTVAA